MRDRFRADGDHWRVTTSGSDSGRDVRTVVFHCMSNATRPYRVVEIASAARSTDELDERELSALFERAHIMDYSHDAAAEPESHGYGDPPL